MKPLHFFSQRALLCYVTGQIIPQLLFMSFSLEYEQFVWVHGCDHACMWVCVCLSARVHMCVHMCDMDFFVRLCRVNASVHTCRWPLTELFFVWVLLPCVLFALHSIHDGRRSVGTRKCHRLSRGAHRTCARPLQLRCAGRRGAVFSGRRHHCRSGQGRWELVAWEHSRSEGNVSMQLCWDHSVSFSQHQEEDKLKRDKNCIFLGISLAEHVTISFPVKNTCCLPIVFLWQPISFEAVWLLANITMISIQARNFFWGQNGSGFSCVC